MRAMNFRWERSLIWNGVVFNGEWEMGNGVLGFNSFPIPHSQFPIFLSVATIIPIYAAYENWRLTEKRISGFAKVTKKRVKRNTCQLLIKRFVS